MPKVLINYLETQIVYCHFEGVLCFCTDSEPSSRFIHLVKKVIKSVQTANKLLGNSNSLLIL